MISSTSMPPVFAPASSRPDPISRRDMARASDVDDESTRVDRKTERATRQTRPEFATLLALLANVGNGVRTDSLRPLPAGNASLLDRLLNGATSEAAIDENGVSADALASMSAPDALRYGLLEHGSRDVSSLTAALAQALSGAAADRHDRASLRGVASANDASSSNALRTLSRLSGMRGVSREQLLALGDKEGANAFSALDALLSRAGTAEGALLANSGDFASLNAATAAALAAENAAAARRSHASTDVNTPVRDPSALAPELRTRLDRVVQRMRDEYGSDVSIVETARSQERQEFLYAQGRTRPGNVVTWTQDSAHTRGDAVDVLVDGSWNNAEGYARLQRIAREEGLRTLGLKDPGHLELPRDGRHTDAAAHVVNMIERRAAPSTTTQHSLATVASVASVAGVASVARVADRGAQIDPTPAPNAATFAYTSSAVSARGTNDNANDSRDFSGNGHHAGSNSSAKSRGPRNADSTTADQALSALNGGVNGAVSAAANAGTVSASGAATNGTGINAAERVADVQALQDSAPAGSLSRMTLEVEGPNGPQRITVDLRGNTVGTHISTDSATADRLRAHTGELQDALGRQGLTADSVRISSNSRVDATTARAVGEQEGIAMTQGAMQNGGTEQQLSGQGPRDRAMAREWEKNEDARKARDELKDEQRQSAGQRGQRGTYNEDAR